MGNLQRGLGANVERVIMEKPGTRKKNILYIGHVSSKKGQAK